MNLEHIKRDDAHYLHPQTSIHAMYKEIKYCRNMIRKLVNSEQPFDTPNFKISEDTEKILFHLDECLSKLIQSSIEISEAIPENLILHVDLTAIGKSFGDFKGNLEIPDSIQKIQPMPYHSLPQVKSDLQKLNTFQ